MVVRGILNYVQGGPNKKDRTLDFDSDSKSSSEMEQGVFVSRGKDDDFLVS